MRVLVDSSSYALHNMGDVAMLQVAVSRLQALWPEATIHVPASSPELLARHCPGTRPVPSNGLRKWMEWSRLPSCDRAPRALSRRFAAADSTFRNHLPGLSDRVALRRAKGHSADHEDIEAFLGVVKTAELLVLAGGGYMTDSFRGHALSSLELLSRFQRRGLPTAMVGQGIGPLCDQELLDRARVTLPRVGLIGTREGRAALPLLESIGVSRERIRVTGDDAIELAFRSRRERLGTSLGVNARVSSYSSVGRDLLGELRSAFRKAAEKVGATALLPVPISSAAADSDVESLRELLQVGESGKEGPDRLDTPLEVVRQVGECRVVVTGSYHAGVFALSQGIPVVGLTRSVYYTDKFLGLADQFGPGCRIVSLDEPCLIDTLSARIGELWREADALRPILLAAAARQVEDGHEAYARLGVLAGKGTRIPGQTAPSEIWG